MELEIVILSEVKSDRERQISSDIPYMQKPKSKEDETKMRFTRTACS